MRRLTAVLGWPIAHSKSPVLHDAAFAAVGLDAVMVPCAVPPDPPARLFAAVRGLAAVDALGASVTVPHKQTVVAACDQLSPLAAAVGAVNCLVFVDGAVHGHNTDVDGFVDGLRAAAVPLAGAAIVLGGGGAARAVAAGLGAAGLTTAVFARRPEAVTWTAAAPWTALPAHLGEAALVVDATSAGLDDAADAALAAAMPWAALAPAAAVASLIYHRPTRFLTAAAARGHRTVDGRAMLVYQAARAFTLWTGVAAPTAAMAAALDASR